MQRFYSSSTGGNYLDVVHGEDMPADAKPISDELYLSLLGKEIEPDADGMPREKPVPQPTFEQRTAGLLAIVDAQLNAAAKAKGYDNILTAALRAALPASPFHAEGLAFGNWMDQVYATCYATLAAVQAGELDEPTEAELIAMLPLLVLPT